MHFFDTTIASRLGSIHTAMRLMMPEVLAKERMAAHTKWWAYRFMSPFEATSHFIDLYRAGLKNYVRIEHDVDRAEKVQGLSSRILGSPSSSLTEVWNARLRADELGVPYELLIEFGFHFASRRKRRWSPRPGQLFASDKSEFAWATEFEKWCVDRLDEATKRLDWLPQYRLEHYRGFPAQDAFREHLREFVGSLNGNYGAKLMLHSVTRRHLPLKDAIRAIPKPARPFAVRDLRSRVETNVGAGVPVEALPAIAVMPACFGIPFARDAASSECQACPAKRVCDGAIASVSAFMEKGSGTVTPEADRRLMNRRAGGRGRSQRFRAKQKEALATSNRSV